MCLRPLGLILLMFLETRRVRPSCRSGAAVNQVGDTMGDTGPNDRQIRVPRKPLTSAFVRKTIPAGRYFDGHGLFLRVMPSGSKQWVQRIVIQGKRTELGLGGAELITLPEARTRAIDNRRLVMQGGSPLIQKKTASLILCFADAALAVHSMHAPTWKNPKHAAQFISTLSTYAFPFVGQKSVATIDSADVLAILSPIWADKNETATRVRQRIGTVLKWAIAQGWRSDDPTRDIAAALPKIKRSKNHHTALAYEKVARCLERIKASAARPTTKLALEFLILTAARSGEVRGAKWSEISLQGGPDGPVWVVPAERMKAGVDHRVPLSSSAVAVIEHARLHSDGSDLIFSGSVQGKMMSDATMRKLINEIGFAVDVHGFRTSFKSWAVEKTSFSNQTSEAALAHTIQNKAEAAYNRSDLFEKRKTLMEMWGRFLQNSNCEVIRIAQ